MSDRDGYIKLKINIRNSSQLYQGKIRYADTRGCRFVQDKNGRHLNTYIGFGIKMSRFLKYLWISCNFSHTGHKYM